MSSGRRRRHRMSNPPAPRVRARTRAEETEIAPAASASPSSASMNAWLSMMPVDGDSSALVHCSAGSIAALRRASARASVDAIGFGALLDAGQHGVLLLASRRSACRNSRAARRCSGITDTAFAAPRRRTAPSGCGGIINAGMDHFAVARRRFGADPSAASRMITSRPTWQARGQPPDPRPRRRRRRIQPCPCPFRSRVIQRLLLVSKALSIAAIYRSIRRFDQAAFIRIYLIQIPGLKTCTLRIRGCAMTGKIGRAKKGAIRCMSAAAWLFAGLSRAGAENTTAAAQQVAEPYFIWNIVIGGLVVGAFVTAIVFWVASALRGVQRQQQQRNEFVGSALNHLGQGIVMLDAQKRVVFFNDRYLDIYKLTRAEIPRGMTGPGLRELRRQRGTADVNEDRHYEKAMSSGGYVAELPDGKFVHIKFTRLPNGGWIGIHEDCTQQRLMQEELANTRQFQQTVLDNIPVSLMVQEVATGRYLFANRNAEVILGRRREDAIGKTVPEMLRPEEAKIIVARDQAAIKSLTPIAEEHPISTRDGLRLFMTRRVTVQGEDGEPQYLIKTHEDVTDRRQTEARMAHMAYHDGLTDLPNRAAFLQALTQMIDACTDASEEFAVLSIDLDGLKEINDVFGHAMGDKLLTNVATRMKPLSAAALSPVSAATSSASSSMARSRWWGRRWQRASRPRWPNRPDRRQSRTDRGDHGHLAVSP